MPRANIKKNFFYKGRERTVDVNTYESGDFASLLLSQNVLRGLRDAGYIKPSPIQLKSIPVARCGLDLIAQAKSGTGKTCVFVVVALEIVDLTICSPQVLILAPTREIAIQINQVVNTIGKFVGGLSSQVFIGGLPVKLDNQKTKNCHLAVGTPGRVLQLIESGALATKSIRLFVLDEADKLLEKNFTEQLNQIFKHLPTSKQILALSATYPECLTKLLIKCMKNPQVIRLDSKRPVLHGVKQYFCKISSYALSHKIFSLKIDKLSYILTKIPFHQCLVFSNYQTVATEVNKALNACGWPSIYIYGAQSQKDRMDAIKKMNDFSCRVLISSDLTARGVDIENIDLVVNLDLPNDPETYLHRVGRAGRFGSSGIAITLTTADERQKLFYFARIFDIDISKLPYLTPLSASISGSALPNLETCTTEKNFLREQHRSILQLSTANQNQTDKIDGVTPFINEHLPKDETKSPLLNIALDVYDEKLDKNYYHFNNLRDMQKTEYDDFGVTGATQETETEDAQIESTKLYQKRIYKSHDDLLQNLYSHNVSPSLYHEYPINVVEQPNQSTPNNVYSYNYKQREEISSNHIWQKIQCYKLHLANDSSYPSRNCNNSKFNTWYTAYINGMMWNEDLNRYLQSLSDSILRFKY
ncbi:putative ATP-dependent RNA helicase DDX20 [Trichoplax sp. H2]|nr:putative ATP-dependent RNA helicase DDX20 [Trichoplax sp. H2]|eukprot:RDD47259.1 putative ATP-dependent RNA helicase DDX20 [Trichoplax sp. H2]